MNRQRNKNAEPIASAMFFTIYLLLGFFETSALVLLGIALAISIAFLFAVARTPRLHPLQVTKQKAARRLFAALFLGLCSQSILLGVYPYGQENIMVLVLLAFLSGMSHALFLLSAIVIFQRN